MRGDQCSRNVARGNLNEHRRLRGRVDVHARVSGDRRAQLLDVDQQGVVTRHGVIGAQLRLFGLQALPVGFDALPAVRHLELRAHFGVTVIDFAAELLHLGFRVGDLLLMRGIAGQQREQPAAVVRDLRENGTHGLHIPRAFDLIASHRYLAVRSAQVEESQQDGRGSHRHDQHRELLPELQTT